MTLRRKALIWFSMLVLIAIADVVIGMFSLSRLNQFTRSSVEDYEVASEVRRLRSLVFGYHRYLYAAALSDNPADASQRDIYRDALATAVNAPAPPGLEPRAENELTTARQQVQSLLVHAPLPGQPASDIALTTEYRERLLGVEASIERLLSLLDAEIRRSRTQAEDFYRSALPTLAILLSAGLALLAWGTVHFRSRILVPFARIRHIVEQINAGDLDARWHGGSADEIGEIGTTLNRLIEQLEARRRERIEMIGSVAHDLKNPLSTLGLECQMFKRNPQRLSEDRAAEVMGRIERQLEKLWRLSDDLLESAKKARSRWTLILREVALTPLILEVLKDFRSSNRDRRFRYSGPSGELRITADPIRVAQVLENLLSNACKYSPRGTEIEVRVEDLGDQVELDVLDRGIGIPSEQRQDAFKSFSRAEEGRTLARGTGLGLAICREIVELHGGSIGVDSRPGGGSVFRVLLPKQPPSQRSVELERVA